MNYWLLLIPILSALTGWLIIRIAIALFFTPITPKKIAGFTMQGIFPKMQPQLAVQAGQYAAKELAQLADGLEEKINDPAIFEKVKPVIEEHIDNFLRHKLKDQMPMISMFIGDKTIVTLKTVFIQEIESLFPQVMQQMAGNFKNELNLEKLVSTKIASLAPADIKTKFYGNFKNEIANASLFGAIIGLLAGLVQLAIAIFTS
jgi:uncharacterized membrane protein YheB (UPF0754 family)